MGYLSLISYLREGTSLVQCGGAQGFSNGRNPGRFGPNPARSGRSGLISGWVVSAQLGWVVSAQFQGWVVSAQFQD